MTPSLTREEALANPVIAAAMGKQVAPPKKRSKYGAVRTQVDGIWFDSKREAERYLVLKMSREVGQVLWFARQARFLLPGPEEYVCDFIVVWADGRVTVEDSKGFRTKEYRHKRRKMLTNYGIEIREV
jgi:hypothetical protein